MSKIKGMVFPILILLLSLTTAQPAGAIAAASDSSPAGSTKDLGKNLTVTLQLPQDSPLLSSPELRALATPAKGGKVDLTVPVTSKKFASLPLAMIGGEPLTVGDYHFILKPDNPEEGHQRASMAGAKPMDILEHLIDRSVMVQEGQEIGLGQVPQIQKKVKIYSQWLLRDMLCQRHIANVKGDPTVAARLYRERAKEYKIQAFLFVAKKKKDKDKKKKDEDKKKKDKKAQEKAKKKAAAKAKKEAKRYAEDFLAQLKKGKSFDKLSAAFSKKKKGMIVEKGDRFVPRVAMTKSMAKEVDKLKPGQMSPIMYMGSSRYVIIKLVAKREQNNPHLKAMAKQWARNYAANMKLHAYTTALEKKYLHFNEKLFKSLDFEKNFKKLRTDQRVLATIKGRKAPYTVADLAHDLIMHYFHGVDRAIKEGKVKQDKGGLLNQALSTLVLRQAARDQGIDKLPHYRRLVRNYEASFIFSAFIQKSIFPNIKIGNEEMKSYYQKHIDDFTRPALLGLRGMAFRDVDKAQAALKSLQMGTDFNWLQANTEGQVPPGTNGLMTLNGDLVSENTLPPGLDKALAGAKIGQYRLYNDSRNDKGFYYVVDLERKVPAKVLPFKQAKREILEKLFSKKVGESLHHWADKLRQAYDVKVYATSFNKTIL